MMLVITVIMNSQRPRHGIRSTNEDERRNEDDEEGLFYCFSENSIPSGREGGHVPNLPLPRIMCLCVCRLTRPTQFDCLAHYSTTSTCFLSYFQFTPYHFTNTDLR